MDTSWIFCTDMADFKSFCRASTSDINLEYVKANSREIHLNGTSMHEGDSKTAYGLKMGVIGQCFLCKIFGANRYRYHRVKCHSTQTDSATDWPPLT